MSRERAAAEPGGFFERRKPK
jgi:hypothetical protein